MGNKVFISYKYGDTSVQSLDLASITTPRNYVDRIQTRLQRDGIHINKGELDGESLNQFKDDTIQSKLADRIFDSSVTIVLVSPNMKDFWKPENDQWIPWEISYSLRKKRREKSRSNRNGILVVWLPDKFGCYNYLSDYQQFGILRNNRNNLARMHPQISLPQSYIVECTWAQFSSQMNYWIELASNMRRYEEYYQITVQV